MDEKESTEGSRVWLLRAPRTTGETPFVSGRGWPFWLILIGKTTLGLAGDYSGEFLGPFPSSPFWFHAPHYQSLPPPHFPSSLYTH